MTSLVTSQSSLENIHHTLNSLWNIPYTNGKHKFGLSALFMLLPGGSTVNLLVKGQYVLIAHRNKAGKIIKFRLAKRLFLDWLLGLPPVLGSVLTWFYKADDKIMKDLKTTFNK
jgi:hypothetical protein